MRQLLCALLSLFSAWLTAQPDTLSARAYIEGNNIKALVNANGSLFWDFEKGQFLTDDEGRSPIRAAGVWLGGVDPGGNLKGAIQMYNEDGKRDFDPGIPGYEGNPADWNRVWKVTGEEILLHLRDYDLDWIINDTIPAIFGWPGNGNPFFKQFHGFDLPNAPHGLAPFYDMNGNGIYNPDEGDFPDLEVRGCERYRVPAEMIWSVAHDSIAHTQSGMIPVNMEVQSQTVAFRCTDNEIANNTILVAYKLINHSLEDIDSVYFGIFVDFQIGCPDDDYIATIPEQNIFFAYNSDDFDEDCGEYKGFGSHPPIAAVKLFQGPRNEFLLELPLSSVMPIGNETALPGKGEPILETEFYNYLTGRWKDGTPLTIGGDGYDPGNPTITKFVFPNRPGFDTTAWTEINAETPPGRRRIVGSYGPFTLQPGAVNELIIGFTYVPGYGTHLDNLTTVYHLMEKAFDFLFLDCIDPTPPFPECTSDVTIPPLPPLPEEFILSPNPASDNLKIQFRDFESVNSFVVFEALGRQIAERKVLAEKIILDVSDWPIGIYFACVKKEKERIVKPFVVMRR